MQKIMFNDKYGLTKAVLEGRKTMTRRSVPEKLVKAIEGGCPGFAVMESKYKVGEVVAVAQSYHALNNAGFVPPEWLDHTCEDSAGYENKMFVRADLMPYQIRITSVRVERLQDISDEDCLREGISKSSAPGQYYVDGLQRPMHDDGVLRSFTSPRDAFAALIDKVSGKGTWEFNPWVFVYVFELIK